METKETVNDTNISLKLFIILSRAYRSVNERVEEDVKGYGLNLTEFAVLELLYHKGDQPIQHIGKKVLLSSGSITYVVDKLEKKKLIVRKPCPKDRRVTWASITEDGKAFMDEIFPKHQNAIENILGGLDTSEKEVMIELLKKLGYFAEKH
ncbi:MarR family winged helix-turn-helix transcriptional regulator [Fredinandcohnia quinoae]|uniref:MarR family transcriptional regulator n=1 Tax=Fredinandcohnia quinoae TaxID=2918902 RepID=A0AAW5EAG3_9BACI|nr:MarR family transcriptional regulator [Fredinandcohnia sp. SECRCQ15]MCH1626967.1 MarR family transcriptional regulator [Fredinandcohnia sp. SECRCQ15]